MFGKTEVRDPERERAKGVLVDARARLAALEGTPMPKLALLRTRHVQRLAKARKYVRDLEEYLATELLTQQ